MDRAHRADAAARDLAAARARVARGRGRRRARGRERLDVRARGRVGLVAAQRLAHRGRARRRRRVGGRRARRAAAAAAAGAAARRRRGRLGAARRAPPRPRRRRRSRGRDAEQPRELADDARALDAVAAAARAEAVLGRDRRARRGRAALGGLAVERGANLEQRLELGARLGRARERVLADERARERPLGWEHPALDEGPEVGAAAVREARRAARARLGSRRRAPPRRRRRAVARARRRGGARVRGRPRRRELEHAATHVAELLLSMLARAAGATGPAPASPSAAALEGGRSHAEMGAPSGTAAASSRARGGLGPARLVPWAALDGAAAAAAAAAAFAAAVAALTLDLGGWRATGGLASLARRALLALVEAFVGRRCGGARALGGAALAGDGAPSLAGPPPDSEG